MEVRVGWGELRRQRELVEAHCWRRGSQAGAQGRRHGHRENDAGLTCRGAAATRESLAAVASRLVSQCQWSNVRPAATERDGDSVSDGAGDDDGDGATVDG